MTTAFVLSGGGSLGAVQVGMLRALADRGFQPDLLVGASAGALNAAIPVHIVASSSSAPRRQPPAGWTLGTTGSAHPERFLSLHRHAQLVPTTEDAA